MIKKYAVSFLMASILALGTASFDTVSVIADTNTNEEVSATSGVLPVEGFQTTINGIEYACYDNIDQDINIDFTKIDELINFVRDGIAENSSDFIDYEYSKITLLLSESTRVHAQRIDFSAVKSNGYHSIFSQVETEVASSSKCLAFLDDSDSENVEVVIVMALGDYIRYMDVILQNERGVLYAHGMGNQDYKVLTAKNSIQCILIHEFMHIFLPRLESCHEYIYNNQVNYFTDWTDVNGLAIEIY